ncbi:D-hexose-6-phosphate mutarotase [Neiella marina]|uniref:Putative glucose-6-phosphate 1-epimerase n=1 Tax=Neiella holothuriorum TaxID=2870530 RepID=A0ABS7ECJ8_9GAMM|nr:D-hexose-6-phosphate mutarotase [Neiella holothuriorum]MBW8189975.1 D-hexose-6-phosphate mutarotase [Neiella holothuriorum]
MTSQLIQLQADYQHLPQLEFSATNSGLIMIAVRNELAQASICLHGAHVCSFQPQQQRPVLWLSSQAQFTEGKAIRGGVPVCWPWFGPHPTDSNLPQHGFARNQNWQLENATQLPSGATELTFVLTDTPASRELWPHAFKLALKVTVATELTLELITTNCDDVPATVGGALHSYFAVGNIAQTRIEGLDQVVYDDKVSHQDDLIQRGDILIDEEVDRVYRETTGRCLIHDDASTRKISVAKQGSSTTVVWNPWTDKAAAMADFEDDGYHHMVCIEAVNSGDDCHTLQPGASHRLIQVINVVE